VLTFLNLRTIIPRQHSDLTAGGLVCGENEIESWTQLCNPCAASGMATSQDFAREQVGMWPSLPSFVAWRLLREFSRRANKPARLAMIGDLVGRSSADFIHLVHCSETVSEAARMVAMQLVAFCLVRKWSSCTQPSVAGARLRAARWVDAHVTVVAC
jgi:hypothetical protein